jgi:hypothetical protein
MPRDEAVKFFRDMGEEYKAQIIASIPQSDAISLYRQGDFVDLCRRGRRFVLGSGWLLQDGRVARAAVARHAAEHGGCRRVRPDGDVEVADDFVGVTGGPALGSRDGPPGAPGRRQIRGRPDPSAVNHGAPHIVAALDDPKPVAASDNSAR